MPYEAVAAKYHIRSGGGRNDAGLPGGFGGWGWGKNNQPGGFPTGEKGGGGLWGMGLDKTSPAGRFPDRETRVGWIVRLDLYQGGLPSPRPFKNAWRRTQWSEGHEA